MSQYIVFKLDYQEYGVEMKDCEEISVYDAIAKGPQSLLRVAGIIGSDSAVIPVYQLGDRSYSDYVERRDKQILMVFCEGRQIGILIDEASKVEELKNQETKIDLQGLITTEKANVLGYGKCDEAVFILLNSADWLMFEKTR